MYRFRTYQEQYRANLRLALPVVLTQVGQILVQFADNVMVGRYGGTDPMPLAAVSFGSGVFFIFFITALGITFGLTPLVGERYARGEHRDAAALFQGSLLLYGLICLGTMLLQTGAIPLMYRLRQPREVVDTALPYYRLLVASMPFAMLFSTGKQFLEGLGNTRTAMWVTIASNLLNILFNWLFIYGRCGCPEMGAEGAGLATLLARILQPAIFFGYLFLRPGYRSYLADFHPLRHLRERSGALLRMGLPIAGQVFLETSAFVLTGIMMGWFGPRAVAAISANQIVTTLANCAFMIVLSVGAATTIRVSHCYGVRDIPQLATAAKASYHLALAWELLTATCFITLRHALPHLFTANAEVIALTADMLIVVALFQLSDGIQNISVGILRGIQDVRPILPIALLAYWGLNLPVGYLCGFTLGLGPVGLILGYVAGLSVAGLLMICRIRRRIRALRAAFSAAEK